MVKSKAIIDKCRDEDIDVKNHMHVVSAGLEATIREWFTPGLHESAVEEAKPVDLPAIRLKPKSTKKMQNAAADADGGSELGGVAVMEKPADEESKAPARQKPFAKKPTPATERPPAGGEVVVDVPAADDEAAAAPGADALRPAAEAPTATTPTSDGAAPPAAPKSKPLPGPQNIPVPAKLSGPRVVRIERPDTVERPRPTYRPPPRPVARDAGPVVPEVEVDDDEVKRRGGPRGKSGRSPADAAADQRAAPRRGIRDQREDVNEKLKEWRDRDLIERADRLAHASGRGIGGLRAIEGKQTSRRSGPRLAPSHSKKEKVTLAEPIIIKDLSREAGIAAADIIKKLMTEHGQMATINSEINTEIAQLIAMENGVELTVEKARRPAEKLQERFDAVERKCLRPRPPVVTVLGHVDHGKTSLLDKIRHAQVAAGEAGGITQHVGAYRARVGDKWVTFLDTPGHAAFTAMRARGANLTDVVVLVVAADDGIMPTTVEAINHARAAEATIVVALNKIDLPHDLNKIYGQLAEHGLTPSGDWGGETDVIKTSAVTGEGLDDLLVHLATLSDVLDLKADPSIPATGTVIEAERTEGLGNVAHVLVREGTLHPGDFVVCGPAFGRVRSLKDERGAALKEAGPSTPVELTGLSDVPMAADTFFVLSSLREAKEHAEEEAAARREESLIRTSKPTSLESLLAGAAEGVIPELPVIIRADVQGSVDVLKNALAEFPADQVKLNIIHSGVGTVTESDLVLAQASDAIVVAFYVVPDPAVRRMADSLGVDIRTYRVIYELIDDIRKALEGLLTPDEKEESRGRAEVREIFNVSKAGRVAGCYVRDGVILRSNYVRVIRDGVVVKDRGAIASLRRFKDDAKEVKTGFECGIHIAGFDDVKPGDVIEAFEVISVARKLES